MSTLKEWKFRPDFNSKNEVKFPSDEALRSPIIGIFSNWIEGITWNMIYKEPVHVVAYNWDVLTRRVIQRGLPGINISPFGLVEIGEKPPIRADKLHLIWSKENPDVTKNMEKAFEQPNLHDTLLKDLQNISMQLEPLKVQVKQEEHIFRTLSESGLRFSDEKELDSWVEATEKSFKETLSEDQKVLFASAPGVFDGWTSSISKDEYDKRKVAVRLMLFGDDRYKEMPDEKLGELVESKRNELKETIRQLEVFRTALKAIARWKREKLYEVSWFAKWPMDSWIAMETLQNVRKDFVSEEKIRENLRILGLPEDRVLPEKGYGKTEYTIPENAEEEEKIRRENLRVETRRKYVQKLQPEVRRIKKELSLEVELDEDLKPNTFKICYIHRSWSDDVTDSTRAMMDWCKTHGFAIKEDKYLTYAELVVPVGRLGDLREMKNEIKKRLENTL